MIIKNGMVPKVLLMGNGINRAFDFSSWDDLIRLISTKELSKGEKECINQVPYPLQPVILTGDHLGTKMKESSYELSKLKGTEDEDVLLRKFTSLAVDAILTANYTYELEKALDPNFKCIPKHKCSYRKTAYNEGGKYSTEQLHTYFSVTEGIPYIWHIHGEAARHNTMILGHYYYGKILAKMQNYISSFLARYKAIESRKQDYSVRSWIDYFMVGEVHIVGLGMALSEMDLWWLVNCKKRHFPDTKVYLYKPDIRLEERLLAEVYGVVVETNGPSDDYKKYYEWLYEMLKKRL